VRVAVDISRDPKVNWDNRCGPSAKVVANSRLYSRDRSLLRRWIISDQFILLRSYIAQSRRTRVARCPRVRKWRLLMVSAVCPRLTKCLPQIESTSLRAMIKGLPPASGHDITPDPPTLPRHQVSTRNDGGRCRLATGGTRVNTEEYLCPATRAIRRHVMKTELPTLREARSTALLPSFGNRFRSATTDKSICGGL
jgi:hypothetical protein